MTDTPTRDTRLDSWKVIAAHFLGRDERTVRRWERQLGLPVRRLPGGRGRSVYAFSSELDAWLKSAPGASDAASADGAASASRGALLSWVASAAVPRSRLARWRIPMAAAVALIAVGAAWAVTHRVAAADLRTETTSRGVFAFDRTGVERWHTLFSPAYGVALPSVDMKEASLVLGGDQPGVLTTTSFRYRKADAVTLSGELMWLGLDGTLQRSFAIDDTVVMRGGTYAPPWAITSVAVRDSLGVRRIAVVAHHYVWSASVVIVLDGEFRRRGTFVHYGWLESVRWVASNRLLVTGYSNGQDGGMVALLDPSSATTLNGQGAEDAGSAGDCPTCGSARPVREVILPRTELNRLTASPFNRALGTTAGNRVYVRTAEVPRAEGGFVDAIYEFTPALDLLGASFSDAYLEMMRDLRRRGRAPAVATEPRRPTEIRVWEPASGWQRMTTTPTH